MNGIYSNVNNIDGGGGDTPTTLLKTIKYTGDSASTNVINDIPPETTNIRILSTYPIPDYGLSIIDLVRDATSGMLNIPAGTYPVGATWSTDSVTLSGDNDVTCGNVNGVTYVALCYNYNI